MKTAIRVVVVSLLLLLTATALVAVSAGQETQRALPGFVQDAAGRLDAQMQRTIQQAQVLRGGSLPSATP